MARLTQKQRKEALLALSQKACDLLEHAKDIDSVRHLGLVEEVTRLIHEIRTDLHGSASVYGWSIAAQWHNACSLVYWSERGMYSRIEPNRYTLR